MTGPAGADGAPGVDGAPGADGADGATGPQGPKGDPFTYADFTPEQLAALKGEQGAVGPKGDKGDKGDPLTFEQLTDEQKAQLTGPAGADGAPGVDGAPGADGAVGPQGPKGEPFTYADFTPEQLAALKGEQGAVGPKGDKGDTGARGATGATGAQGPKGDTGATGPQGPKGDTGATGPQGPKGDPGDPSGENLLDNAYLADPVNQRGVTVLPINAYGIDRWIDFIGSDVNAAVMEGYTFIPANHVLSQWLEPGTLKHGQVYTASVLTLEGQLYTGTHVYTLPDQPFSFITNAAINIYFSGENLFQFRALSDLNVVAVEFRPGDRQTVARWDTDKWVFRGAPPNKALELAKCQRYYFRTGRYYTTGCVTTGATQYMMPITTPVQMRISPTAKMKGYFARLYNGYSVHTSSSSVTPPTKLTVYAGPSGGVHQVVLIDQIESAVDVNNSILYYQINDLELDANL